VARLLPSSHRQGLAWEQNHILHLEALLWVLHWGSESQEKAGAQERYPCPREGLQESQLSGVPWEPVVKALRLVLEEQGVKELRLEDLP
jgi:hypothetical protein